MLEDGDKTEALKAAGKKVVSVDLNPLSRTARKADVTIVDNIVRAVPNMSKFAGEMKKLPKQELASITELFDNERNLKACEELVRGNLGILPR